MRLSFFFCCRLYLRLCVVKFAGSATEVSALFDGFTYELSTGTVQYGFHGIIRKVGNRVLLVQWFGPDVDKHLYAVSWKNLFAPLRTEFEPACEKKFPVMSPDSAIMYAKTSTHAATATA